MTNQSRSSASSSARSTSSGPPPRNLTTDFGPSPDSLSDSSLDSVEATILNHKTSLTNDEIIIDDSSPPPSLPTSPPIPTFEPTIAQIPTQRDSSHRVAFHEPSPMPTQSPPVQITNDTTEALPDDSPHPADRAQANDSNPTNDQSVVMNVEAIPPPVQNPTQNQHDPNVSDNTTTFKECRYSLMVTVPPSKDPWPVFVNLLRKFLKLIQEQVHKNVWISTWDKEMETTEKIIKLPKDFPTGSAKNRKHFSNYFSGYPNPRKDKESKVFLKVRFITRFASSLPFPLEKIGQEIQDLIPQDLTVYLSRNPYACQAVNTETLGWLYGSTKTMDSSVLVPAIRETLNIPDHVAFGVQWRTIKNEHKKNYPWNEGSPPPQALHFDIDANFAARYVDETARFWRRGARQRVLGLQLRLVPCYGSSRSIALSSQQRKNINLMASKQQHLINSHIVKIDNTHILSLDTPVGPNGDTLRRYLMSRAPPNSVIQRIFVTADRSWNGNHFILTTVRPYVADAFKIIGYMIPECLHLYGVEAGQQWFTNAGLEAFQNVEWDPARRSTTSNQDAFLQDIVDEDLFELTNTWQAPGPGGTITRQEPTTAATTALISRTTDADVHSFASIYDRQHDGESIATANPTPQDQPIRDTTITFDSLILDQNTNSRNQRNNDDASLGMSSAGFTTNSTRVRLREQTNANDTLRRENAELLARLESQNATPDDQSVRTTVSTAQRLAQMMRENAILTARLQQQETSTTTNLTPAQSQNPATAPLEHPNQGAVPVTPHMSLTNANPTGTVTNGAGQDS